MRIIFIRHPESTKNTSNTFSSHENQEPLTSLGRSQVDEITNKLADYFHEKKNLSLYSATSLRAMSLSYAISQALGTNIVQCSELNSIDSGKVAGLDKEKMNKVAPGYFHKMELYEAGVKNAYSIDHPGEPLIDFEKKLGKLLYKIEQKDSIAIIVAHKSAITAALIRYARKSGIYPKSFFGYIPLNTAHFSVIDVLLGDPDIKEVNMTAKDISSL